MKQPDNGQGARLLPHTEQRFPAGWDEQRVKRLLAELDARTEEE